MCICIVVVFGWKCWLYQITHAFAFWRIVKLWIKKALPTTIFIYLWGHSITTYVDKMRGSKMSVFVHAQSIKTIHAGRGQKMAKFYPRNCWMPSIWIKAVALIWILFSWHTHYFHDQKLLSIDKVDQIYFHFIIIVVYVCK